MSRSGDIIASPTELRASAMRRSELAEVAWLWRLMLDRFLD